MGTKGDRLTEAATERAAWLVDELAGLGEVTSKKMFGGYGIFESDVMFALIDSDGTAHLRSSPTDEHRYVEAGASKHGRMPYWSIPDAVASDHEQLVDWATEALGISRSAKKR